MGISRFMLNSSVYLRFVDVPCSNDVQQCVYTVYKANVFSYKDLSLKLLLI